MNIEIKAHTETQEDVIEISNEEGLVATIIPRDFTITIISKHITGVIKEMDYPQGIIIELGE
jgi:hypothetical protein